MSYCRCNGKDSTVYVYGSDEYLICCGCRGFGYETKSRKEMIMHLINDIRRGETVPDYAFNRLIDELITKGDTI